MPKTYTPIATVNLTGGSSGANISYFQFTNIPQTYTDLVISINAGVTGSAGYDLVLQFNGDTASNYSQTFMRGNGSAAVSSRVSNNGLVYLDYTGGSVFGINRNYLVNIMNYSNSTTYKTFLSRANSANDWMEQHVALWRSTAAITSLIISTNGGSVAPGSTATLYGIKAA
jgi:hypothetical protein